MDYLGKEFKKEFNWDDIEVGNHNLDHSQNFFAANHMQKETLESTSKEISMIETELDIIEREFAKISSDCIESDENKENVKEDNCCVNPENLQPTQDAASVSLTPQSNSRPLPLRSRLRSREWSVKKVKVSTRSGAIPKSTPATPHAYKIKDKYKEHRDQLQRRRAEEERKMREFHAKPIPNLNSFVEKLRNKPVTHTVTIPTTPTVLKRSKEREEKLKKEFDELNQKPQPMKRGAGAATVLQEKPFVPDKKLTVVEQLPFNLHLEERLERRKQYDEAIQKAFEEKRKKEEEERKKVEDEHRKELRKATTFKARPNPFKH